MMIDDFLSQDEKSKLIDAITVVSSYVETDDWLTVKKQLLLTVLPSIRLHFSKYDRKTKTRDQSMNDFERDLVDLWYEMTGNRLILKNRKC